MIEVLKLEIFEKDLKLVLINISELLNRFVKR